jgi:hypothetical protein
MPNPPPQICYLSHPSFRMLGEPLFRLSDGPKAPSMIVKLDGQTAVLPLKSLAREFGIAAESPDGIMLKMIEQALDYVVMIKPGDTFPPELAGGSSWEPTEHDRMVASSLMWHSLVRCVFHKLGRPYKIEGGVKPGWEAEPVNQPLAKEAIDIAAKLLGIDDRDRTEARVALVISELGYIEALRRMLSRGIAWITEKLIQRPTGDAAASRIEALKQVQSLARRGIEEINSRFEEIDVMMDDVLSLLEDTGATMADLKRRRDWLHRTNHAWTPLFTDWANAPTHADEFLWKTVERSYLFLAPRYMPFKEWSMVVSDFKAKKPVTQVW